MIKIIFISLVMLVSNSSHAQNGAGPLDSSSTTGRVYFMRSTGFTGSGSAFTVFIDDSLVCRLNNKRYSVHEVIPGTHRFSVQFSGKRPREKAERIEIKIEPGKEYYVQLIFQPGMFVNNLYCQEVTGNSAKTMLPGLKADRKCK